MIRTLLVLRHLKVENANAVAGLTWGFPAISNFLGFSHALSRKLDAAHGLRLGGCAVIAHRHQVKAQQPAGWGDYVFSLNRNPLTKEGKPPAFVEEARMHMDVSLLIECEFDADDLEDVFYAESAEADQEALAQFIRQQVLQQRLAGGSISSIESIKLETLSDDGGEQRRMDLRRLMMRFLPGFLLVNRSDVLQQHFEALQQENPQAEKLDALLDFVAFKQQADPLAEGEEPEAARSVKWQRLEKPASGYLVPITTGYKGISPLYEAGQVARTRDPQTPFRFVESIYSIGQWISPHRISNLESILWHYRVEDDWYLCENSFGNAAQQMK